MGILASTQCEQLWNALLDAYDKDSLARMLKFRLNIRLDQIIGEDSLRDMIFELIGVAEMEGWTANLISAARESQPTQCFPDGLQPAVWPDPSGITDVLGGRSRCRRAAIQRQA